MVENVCYMGEDVTRPSAMENTGIRWVCSFTFSIDSDYADIKQEFILTEGLLQNGSLSRRIVDSIQDVVDTS